MLKNLRQKLAFLNLIDWLPYSRKFSLVQNFTEMRPDFPEKTFMVFIFAEQMCNADHTLSVDGHAPRVNQRNDTERWSKEASLCNNGLVFLLCGGLCFYESIRTTAVDGKSLMDTALLISALTTLEHLYRFIDILYTDRVILPYSNQKRAERL